MCVADGTRRPSMRARTPTKLDSFARCRAPHHGPQSPRRPSCTAAAAAAAPSSRSSEAVCAFSARARSFSLRLVSPRGALPLRCSPVSVSVSVSVCSEESRLFHGHFRIREGHDQTRGKNSGKQILTTLPGNFGARLCFSVCDVHFGERRSQCRVFGERRSVLGFRQERF